MGVRARYWWIGVIVLVAAVGVAAYLARARSGPRWTTSSPEALDQFEQGIDANMKLYRREAIRHFRRAVELDPDFVMARVMLAQTSGVGTSGEAMEKLRTLVDSIDLSKLTRRERFLVQYLAARLDEQNEDAEQLLDRYLEHHPKDPYALNIKANILWSTGDLSGARSAFERLVKISPNWVVGYNSLGYIAMEQGDFAKSEENFSTYKFIAPDQANPFDSLGELYLLTGRYDEAIREFQGALKIKRDFCASWDHLATAYLLDHNFGAARALLEQVDVGNPCSERWSQSLRCAVELYPDAMAHRWQTLLQRAEKMGCSPGREIGYDILVHRAAAMTAKLDLCDRIEEHWRKLASRPEAGERAAITKVLLEHGRGVRAVAAGDYPAAMEIFRKVDGTLRLRGSGEGLFKLFNLACLAEVEGVSDLPQAEKKSIEKIRKVNPSMASAYESGTFRPFGLSPAPGG